MSTARDGETTRIVVNFLTLKDRLKYLLKHAQPSPHDVSRSWRQNLNESAWILDLWEQEHIDASKRTLREETAVNEEKVSRVRKRLEEALDLVRHCEYTVKISYPRASLLEPRLTEYVAFVLVSVDFNRIVNFQPEMTADMTASPPLNAP
jgi:hypothetical protein